ncbi:hypothetical protein GCM10027284_08750 [Cyclobacterium sediminis]
MFYIIPTKKGIGVELWGPYEDFINVYTVLSKFWNDENRDNDIGFESRDKLLSGFSFELRKAYEGSRLKRNNSHFHFDKIEHLGCQISWVHLIFSLHAWKYNMRFYEKSKFDIATILLLEFWTEKAMNTYDEVGAKKLKKFIDDGIYSGNEYIYQFMRSINIDYIKLGGGKLNFRKLPELLNRGVSHSEEYKDYTNFLESEAKGMRCEIADLELIDDHINYEIEW